MDTDKKYRADCSRRVFLGAMGAAALASGARRPFEVSASLYAWDLHDEGVECVLDNLQEMSAVNSVYLIGLMHPEKRPLTQDVFPHNPVRKTWVAEDARAYWHPDFRSYGRIKPRLSDHAWLNQTDWVDVLVKAARKRHLKTGVEFSHALVDKERANGEFADRTQRDLRGGIPRGLPWLRPLCPNHPDTRQYALALFRDLVKNHDLDYVQSCIIPFDPGGPERGGCFCDFCEKAAAKMGFDLESARQKFLDDPKSEPEASRWQAFRYESVAQFYRTIHEGVHACRPGIELRYNLHTTGPSAYGVNVKVMQPHLDSLRIMDYSEQTGDPAALDSKRERLKKARRELGAGFPIVSAVAVRPKATPELIRRGVQVAVECGMDGITLGHYDGAEFPMLRAICEGLTAAGKKV